MTAGTLPGEATCTPGYYLTGRTTCNPCSPGPLSHFCREEFCALSATLSEHPGIELFMPGTGGFFLQVTPAMELHHTRAQQAVRATLPRPDVRCAHTCPPRRSTVPPLARAPWPAQCVPPASIGLRTGRRALGASPALRVPSLSSPAPWRSSSASFALLPRTV